MPGLLLRALRILTHLVLTTTYEVGLLLSLSADKTETQNNGPG